LPRPGCCANCGLGEPRPLLTRQKNNSTARSFTKHKT
jgi:hypothetical protein